MPASSFGDYRQYQWEALQNSRPFLIPWTHLRHWSYSEDLIHQQSTPSTMNDCDEGNMKGKHYYSCYSVCLLLFSALSLASGSHYLSEKEIKLRPVFSSTCSVFLFCDLILSLTQLEMFDEAIGILFVMLGCSCWAPIKWLYKGCLLHVWMC